MNAVDNTSGGNLTDPGEYLDRQLAKIENPHSWEGIARRSVIIVTFNESVAKAVRTRDAGLFGEARDLAEELYLDAKGKTAELAEAGVRYQDAAAQAVHRELSAVMVMLTQEGRPESSLKNVRNYRNSLVRCMELSDNDEFIERNDAGDPVLGGRNKMDKWSEGKTAELKEREEVERARKMAEKGLHIGKAPVSAGSDDSTGSNDDGKGDGTATAASPDWPELADLHPELKEEVESIILVLFDMQMTEEGRETALEKLAPVRTKLTNLVKHQFRDAIAAAKAAVQEEMAKVA